MKRNANSRYQHKYHKRKERDMPTYIYACDKEPIKHEKQEIVHGFHDRVIIKCVNCDSSCHRVMQANPFWINKTQEALDKEWNKSNR